MSDERPQIGTKEHRPPRSDDPAPPGAPPASAAPDGGLFQTRYREVTLSAIIFGVIVGAIMNMAITYAGLKIGFTIVGSSIAAVLGFGVLRGALRRGSILEVNIGQTIASAVNTPNSGVIFTVPVLFLIGVPLVSEAGVPNGNFWLLTLACIAGAVMGCAFIVPLRKQMLDIERLRFPSATAVGAILKSPGAGAKKSVVLVTGIVLSALIALPAQLPQIKINASYDQLDSLVERGKITFEDKLRTEMIESWIVEETAPTAVLAHGLALVQLDEAKDRGAEDLADLEDAIPALEETAFADIAERTASGATAVTGYKEELARRVFRAKENPELWRTLRSGATGWAQRPLWGYSDLGIRASSTPKSGEPGVDFASNGLGQTDVVLDPSVDRDRDGRPDLLVTDDTVDVGRITGLPAQMQLIFAIAPFALGAGYLTGRAGLYVLAGGVLAYLVLNPIVYGLGWMPEGVDAAAAPGYGYSQINRPLGIGLLLGGAMMGVLASLPAIKEALKSIVLAGGQRGGRVASDELGVKVLIAAVVFAFVFLFAASFVAANKPINTTDPFSGSEFTKAVATTTANGYTIGFESAEGAQQWTDLSDDEEQAQLKEMRADRAGLLAALPPVARALIIALIGAAWIWFAGIIIAQCTGMTDWSPISGMALITVVLVMVLAGVGDQVGAVMIGAALCVAITCASDMMADLKTGYIVGAQPRRQQIVEMISTGIGPLITMGVLLLIAATNFKQYGIYIGDGTPTTAPQAQALQAVITGVQGGDMPYALYGLGAVLGALLGLGSFAGLGVLVGLSMYLPMVYIATYGIGCVLNMIAGKVKGRAWAEEWGVPLAAGFIVGDALLGLCVNFIVLIWG